MRSEWLAQVRSPQGHSRTTQSWQNMSCSGSSMRASKHDVPLTSSHACENGSGDSGRRHLPHLVTVTGVRPVRAVAMYPKLLAGVVTTSSHSPSNHRSRNAPSKSVGRPSSIAARVLPSAARSARRARQGRAQRRSAPRLASLRDPPGAIPWGYLRRIIRAICGASSELSAAHHQSLQRFPGAICSTRGRRGRADPQRRCGPRPAAARPPRGRALAGPTPRRTSRSRAPRAAVRACARAARLSPRACGARRGRARARAGRGRRRVRAGTRSRRRVARARR